ncbi:UNVERIFIED_CONTAM: hypothetical protein Sradi_6868000 [Sesamum radiatum]|uniref:Uncharacterized protein n=1 Tax=Sesamum radiatum TaxID=300843 RepID=A0AAW2JK03_SESRA
MNWAQRMVFDAAGQAYKQHGAADDGMRSCPLDVDPSSYYYGGGLYDYLHGLADRFQDVLQATEQPLWNGCTTSQLAVVAELVDIKRLYASHVTIEQMTWHANHQTEEGSMCYQSEEEAWKHFDRTHPDLAAEPRNIRLGLCTDGFALHGQYDHAYSYWPVILTLYNLPLGMCMSSEYVPNDGDIWPFESETASGETFAMRAALMWTVNDLPAFGMASGWGSAGVMGCSVARPRLTGEQIRDWVEDFSLAVEVPLSLSDGYGVEYKWTKKSIFWELEYWSTHLIRYNLDVMHIEKNVFDNIFNTVMDIKCKTKDNLNARKDLKIICNRPNLGVDERRPNVMPKAVYTLTREQKKRICEWITHLKFLDGYASNLARCVDMKELRL